MTPNGAQLLIRYGIDRAMGKDLVRFSEVNLRRKDGGKVGHTQMQKVEEATGYPWWLVHRHRLHNGLVVVVRSDNVRLITDGGLTAEESRLSAKETGLLEFLAWYATGGSVWSQAKGHIYGSHNLGNTKEEIYGAIHICKLIEQQLGIVVNRELAENWSWTAKAEKWSRRRGW